MADQTTIGVLHPGEMGSGVGASAKTAGARVLWASEGRGAATEEVMVPFQEIQEIRLQHKDTP